MKRLALLSMMLLAACSGGSGFTTPSAPDNDATGQTMKNGSVSEPHASPASVVFTSAAPRKVKVTEPGYKGGFSERTTCDPLAGAIAVVARTATAAGSATYAVTPEGAGTCAISFHDAKGKAVNVSVRVTSAAITVH